MTGVSNFIKNLSARSLLFCRLLHIDFSQEEKSNLRKTLATQDYTLKSWGKEKDLSLLKQR
jgi:hypothetical protein